VRLSSIDVRRALVVGGVATALVLVGASIVRVPSVARLGIGVLTCVVGLYVLASVCARGDDEDERARIIRWTMGSFALHALIGAAIASSVAMVTYIGPDAFSYHAWASERVAQWTTGVHSSVVGLGPGKSGFTQLLAMFYWLTTPSMVAGAIMNAGFAAALVPVLDRATKVAFGQRAARPVPALVTFVPAFLIWPSQLLREAPILFFLSLLVLSALLLQRRTTMPAMLTLVTAGVLLFDFRGTLAYPLCAVVLLAIALSRREIAFGVINAASVITALTLAVGLLGVGFSGYRYASDRDLDDLNRFRQNTSIEATSGFDDDSQTDTGVRAATYVLVAAPRLLFGPMPWQATTARQAPAVLDALVWWWCMYWAIRGLRSARLLGSRRRLLALLLPAGSVVVMLSLALGNYGLVVRQRPQVLVFLVPLVAFGLSSRRGLVPDAAVAASPAAAGIAGR
jgi:hypothetical protein